MLVLVLVLLSCAIDNTIGILMLMPVASHDQNSYVEPQFDLLDLKNTKMLLITPSISLNASAHGIT